MEDILEYLPEEYFEIKKDGQALYYHPPDDREEFLMHYQTYWPVRLWVNEVIEDEGFDQGRLTVLGVWADRPTTIHFTKDGFEMSVL